MAYRHAKLVFLIGYGSKGTCASVDGHVAVRLLVGCTLSLESLAEGTAANALQETGPTCRHI